jgi:hypothetical protein
MGMGSGRLITPQSALDEEAAFLKSNEYRAAEMLIQTLVPQLQSIQNALDLQLQIESGFLKRKDMKERFENFFAKMADELAELKAQQEQTKAEVPTPEVVGDGTDGD